MNWLLIYKYTSSKPQRLYHIGFQITQLVTRTMVGREDFSLVETMQTSNIQNIPRGGSLLLYSVEACPLKYIQHIHSQVIVRYCTVLYSSQLAHRTSPVFNPAYYVNHPQSSFVFYKGTLEGSRSLLYKALTIPQKFNLIANLDKKFFNFLSILK